MHGEDTAVVDVAAGIVTRTDGSVLMAERPAGRPWAGYWEFPGGKFESGESPVAALGRELHEELGIEIDHAYPWITRIYDYPERRVRLHMYRVLKWHGKPHGKEGQQISWENPLAVQCQPLLPANDAILRFLCLPQIYAITKASKYGIAAFMQRLQIALENGIRLIQVRERMVPGQLTQFARNVVSMAHEYGARVLINGSENMARTSGADGVHYQTSQLMRCKRRPKVALWGASCHNLEELLRAAELGVDLVVLSPVLPTQSHPGEPTLGWDKFSDLCRDLPMPVYALGGMNKDQLDTAMTRGAHGIAMLSGVW
jgi:8-oxo-dGTP diphosphatase